MTGPPGTGGTPPPPAGYVPPSLPDQAAGSRAGILLARLVRVSGTGANTGIFVYSGIPAAGNLVFSVAPAGGTDPFGNVFVAGAAVYGSSGSQFQLFTSAGLALAQLSTGDALQVVAGFLNSSIQGAGGTRQLQTALSSPQFTANPAQLLLQSQSQDNTINSQIQLFCINKTVFGASGNAWWADGTQQLNLPAGGGPFIFGEGFHAVTLPVTGGFSGTIRVKKLPWNAIFLDYALKWTNTAGGTFTCGSLPDATYYPTNSTPRRYPMGTGGTPTGDAQAGLFVPSSGALSVFVNASVAGSPDFASGSFTYPTN